MRFVDGQSDLHTGGAMPIAGRPLDPSVVSGAILVTRTNGIAPMGVVFQAGQSGFATARPGHELRYKWRFPDQGNYSAPATDHPWGLSRQVAYGPIAAFVFTEPGQHVVTLEVTDGDLTATETFTVTVADPDILFAGAQTYAISTTDFAGAPMGAVQMPSLAAARADAAGSGRRNVRFLFARGQSHDIGAGAGAFAAGDFDNIHLGAFGSGDRPELTGGGVRSEGDAFSGAVAVTGLRIVGGFDPVTGVGAGAAGDGLDLRGAATHCVTGCEITGFDTAIRTESGLSDVVISDCTITGWSAEGVVFDDADRVALLGCAVVPAAGTDPAFVSGGPGRIEGAAPGRAVIWQCDLHSINAAPCWRWNADGAPTASGLIGACRMEGGAPVLELAPSNPGGLDRAGDLIVERCYLLGGAHTGAAGAVKLTFGGTTLRNSVAILPDVAPLTGVDAPAFLTGAAPQTNAANDASPVRVHSNSFVDLRTPATLSDAATALAEVDAADFAHWTNAEIVNQLVHAPGLQTPVTPHAPLDETPVFTPREAAVPAGSAARWAPVAKADDTDSATLGSVALDDFGGTLRVAVAEKGAREIPGVLSLTAGGQGGALGQGLQPGEAEVEVVSPVSASGNYPLDVTDLATGPVGLQPPTIDGTLTVGDTLTATPGVVAWDPALGRPLVLYQWLRGNAPLPGETGLTHDVVEQDIALGVSFTQTVHSAGLFPLEQSATVSAVSFTSQGVSVPVASSLETTTAISPTSVDNVLVFFCVEYNGGFALACDTGGGGLQVLFNGSRVKVTLKLDSGQSIALRGDHALPTGQKICFLAAAQHSTGRTQVYMKIGTADWEALEDKAGVLAGSGFDLSNVPTVFYSFTSWVNYRAAVFLPASFADISDPGVRDLFVQQDGNMADPALSQSAYGLGAIDIYGDAATLSAGTHFGTMPSLLTNGSFFDV